MNLIDSIWHEKICTTLPSTRHFFTYYFPSLFGELSSDDDDIAPERVESICSGSTSITEKSIDSEKGTCRSTSSTGMYIENLGGVITIGTVDRRLLMEGDKDFIKITQQTVVEISSAWEWSKFQYLSLDQLNLIIVCDIWAILSTTIAFTEVLYRPCHHGCVLSRSSCTLSLRAQQLRVHIVLQGCDSSWYT